MKRPSIRRHLLSPESIALTDMVMNLFIFFFVSFSLLYTFHPDRSNRLEVTLPKAEQGRGAKEPGLTVTITKEGIYSVEEKTLSEGQLMARLKESFRHNPNVSVTIRADEWAPCKALVAVFDGCRTAGITRTGFAVLPNEKRGLAK